MKYSIKVLFVIFWVAVAFSIVYSFVHMFNIASTVNQEQKDQSEYVDSVRADFNERLRRIERHNKRLIEEIHLLEKEKRAQNQ